MGNWNWRELLKYQKWIPVNEENVDLVYEKQSIGIMRITFGQEKDGGVREYARLTPRGYRLAKREQISEEKGLVAKIRRVLYRFFSIRGDSNLGEWIFVGNWKDS